MFVIDDPRELARQQQMASEMVKGLRAGTIKPAGADSIPRLLAWAEDDLARLTTQLNTYETTSMVTA